MTIVPATRGSRPIVKMGSWRRMGIREAITFTLTMATLFTSPSPATVGAHQPREEVVG